MNNNSTGIKRTNGMNTDQILLNVQHQVSLSVVVSKDIDESAVVTVNGKKYVKAGTPLSGSLDARTTPFVLGKVDTTPTGTDTTPTVATATPVGVLLEDVEITTGNANGTLLIFGFVNTNRLANSVKTLLTSDVKTALNAKVTFIAG